MTVAKWVCQMAEMKAGQMVVKWDHSTAVTMAALTVSMTVAHSVEMMVSYWAGRWEETMAGKWADC